MQINNTIPKGTLLPIGGGEDRLESKDVLCRMIAETGKKNPTICLITLATSVPERMAEVYHQAFRDLNITRVSVIHYGNRCDADSAENLKKAEDCDLVLFGGGKQLQLSTLLAGTALLEVLRRRYHGEAQFVIAGTSAGAAAMSNTMIIAGSSIEALIKGSLKFTDGLNLIHNVSIDTHFTQRGRIGRLIELVTCNPGVLGLGLGEDTGVVISQGLMEVCGSGEATVVDGSGILCTDDIETDDLPIPGEGIKVHILKPGKKYIIAERMLLGDG
jgi:cyanophycinase